MIRFRVVALIGILVASGCNGSSPYINETRVLGIQNSSLTLDASRRTIIVRHEDGGFCSEPVPDVMGTLFTNLASELTAKGGDPTIKAELSHTLEKLTSSNAMELFQRSQGVQVLRDGLYRLCEANLNKAISKEEYLRGLQSLITTLNFVVPLELCTRLADQRVVNEASTSPSAGQTPASNTTKVTTDRRVTEETMKHCINQSWEFARFSSSFSAPRTIRDSSTPTPSIQPNVEPGRPHVK